MRWADPRRARGCLRQQLLPYHECRIPHSLEIYADPVLDSISTSLDRLGCDQVESPELVVLAIEAPRIKRRAGPLLELVKGAGDGHSQSVIPTIRLHAGFSRVLIISSHFKVQVDRVDLGR